MLSRVDKGETEEELKWSDDEDEEETAEENEEMSKSGEEGKVEVDKTITEQPSSAESCTEGTVTPEKVSY